MSGAQDRVLLVVFFDALGDNLVRRVQPPFLARVGLEGGSRSVVPSLGFCEYTPAFTGKDPAEAGHLTLFRFTRRSRAFGWLARLGPFAAFVPRRVVNRIAPVLDRDVELRGTAAIPIRSLPRLEVVEVRQSFWSDPRYGNIVQQAGMRGVNACRVAGPPFWRSGEENLRLAVSRVRAGARLVVVHLPDLDGLGHRHGGSSPEVERRLLELDGLLDECVSEIRALGLGCDVLAFGDHGMVPVVGTIGVNDLRIALREAERRGRVTLFLDSTMARVRVWDERELSRTRELLGALPHGRVLSERELREWGSWFEDRSYGDVIFLADEGYILSPNFFQGPTQVRGMHGYSPEVTENHGYLGSTIPVPSSWPAAVPMKCVYQLAVTWLQTSDRSMVSQ